MSEETEILLNGEKRKVAGGSSVLDLIQYLRLKGDQVAVEVNREIIRRECWSDRLISENDEIEIVHFVGGGEGR